MVEYVFTKYICKTPVLNDSTTEAITENIADTRGKGLDSLFLILHVDITHLVL